MAGGRLPPGMVVVSTCTPCSALPPSSSLTAPSMARWASTGSCFFRLGLASGLSSFCSPASSGPRPPPPPPSPAVLRRLGRPLALPGRGPCGLWHWLAVHPKTCGQRENRLRPNLPDGDAPSSDPSFAVPVYCLDQRHLLGRNYANSRAPCKFLL